MATIQIPTPSGSLAVELKPGTTTVFVGANGSGKTRLGVLIDRQASPITEVHRVAAHRSLALNPNVQPPNLEAAMKQLRYGYVAGTLAHKEGHRWQSAPEVVLLNDFDFLMAALYAEENNASVKFRQDHIRNPDTKPPKTKLDHLKEIWHALLPHRTLLTLDSTVRTKSPEEDATEYLASQMSDGERVIFYLLGQALLAEKGSIIVIDEPELHINKAIVNKLFDEIEAARSDCAFVYITHDVEFAASRRAATKYVLRSFSKNAQGDKWDIGLIPEDTNIPDSVVAMILGSRVPVLFVEGDGGSLDISLFRRIYSEFTVVPVGSCETVIHTVASFAARKELHRIGCAGLIDADGRLPEEIAALETSGIYVLPVSEAENLILLPGVFTAVAKLLLFDEAVTKEKLACLKEIVFSKAMTDIDRTSLGFARRRIDSLAKTIGLASTDIAGLEREFGEAIAKIKPTVIFNEMRTKLSNAIAKKDYEEVLRHYDNKGLLAEAARQLGLLQKVLEELIGRSLRGEKHAILSAPLSNHLPKVVARF
jgi:AAA domain, putative AbiEii toxin, Type IV TA system/Protein of unknown function (DUF4435)